MKPEFGFAGAPLCASGAVLRAAFRRRDLRLQTETGPVSGLMRKGRLPGRLKVNLNLEEIKMKLHKSRTDRWIGGVCGGLAESLGIDAIWIRLLFVFGGGVLFWVYLALLIFLQD